MGLFLLETIASYQPTLHKKFILSEIYQVLQLETGLCKFIIGLLYYWIILLLDEVYTICRISRQSTQVLAA